ncbi:hypothetical protein J3P89_05065 [Pseudomonas sp. Z1-14]|uniref:hypothetical protein n=1 Tax=unclassified Pseudomonas TaxID=196821 RepID=UPI003DA88E1F
MSKIGACITLSATLAFAVSTAFAAVPTDISGVALGSTLEEAKDAIMKANQAYTISPLKTVDGTEAGVTAVTNKTLAQADQFAALQDDAGKVWFVGHMKHYEEGSRIPLDNLVASLTEKFGPTSFRNSQMGEVMYWEFDRNGKLYKGVDQVFNDRGIGPCAQVHFSNMHIPGVSFPAPQNFPSECSLLIMAYSQPDQDKMVREFSLSVTDVKSMYDQLNAKETQAKAEQARKLEEEKSKAAKPNI